MQPPSALAKSFLIAALAAIVATFMPWGSVSLGNVLGRGPLGNVLGLGMDSMSGNTVIDANAYASSITVAIVRLPNWTPALVAACLACWACLGAKPSHWASVGLVYGLAHTLFAAYLFYREGGGAFGLGVLVTAGAFVAMLLAIRRQADGEIVGDNVGGTSETS